MLKRTIVVSIPAILIASWLIFERLYSWPSGHNTNSGFSWFLWLGVPQLVGLTAALLSNLLEPVATNQRAAISIGILSLVVYTSFFLLSFIGTLILDPNSRNLEYVGMTTMGFCTIIIPSGLILMLGVSSAGWLGANIRLRYMN